MASQFPKNDLEYTLSTTRRSYQRFTGKIQLQANDVYTVINYNTLVSGRGNVLFYFFMNV